ncbi:MAG: metallophosphoesterase family protein [Longimicrobiales bacterium]
MLTILHISDLHFGPFYVPRVGEALLGAANELNADIIVASGDFTQRAKPAEFQQARALLDALPDVPKVVIPGNHDVPLYRFAERAFRPFMYYKQYISEELETVLRHKDARIVALNTTAPLRAIVNGRIEPHDLEFCRESFKDVPAGVAKIVVAHHHFAPAPDYEGGDVMPHAKEAMEAFAEMGVDMVLGGHLHRAYIGNSLDVYPGIDRDQGVIIIQSGTTTSRRGRAREREKNSFNLIRITEDRVRVTHYMYFSDMAGFAPISRHLFPRPGKHYLSDLQEPADVPSASVEGVALAPPVGVEPKG